MVFGGVEIGSMKLQDAPMTTGSINTSGSIPAAIAPSRTIGNDSVATAVLLATSDRKETAKIKQSISTAGCVEPMSGRRISPNAADNPVGPKA